MRLFLPTTHQEAGFDPIKTSEQGVLNSLSRLDSDRATAPMAEIVCQSA